jgi:hypothetical protein
MDLFKILLIAHILGGVVGVGAATFLEIFLNKSLRDGSMDVPEREFMRTTASTLRAGLFISIFTGVGLILSYRINDQLHRLYDPVLWAKFTILFVLMVNGILLQMRRIPLLIGSAVSFVSWYSVFILGLLVSGPAYPYVTVVYYYVIALFLGGTLLETIRRMLGIRI